MDVNNTILDSQSLEQEHDVTAYEYAGFWRRFAASLVDGIILSIPNSLFPKFEWRPDIYTMMYVSISFSFIIQWLYFAFMQSSDLQATLGQRLLKIKLVSLNGNPIDFGQATGRFFAKILSALIFGIGYFMFFFTEKRQCLHDILAGTIVVKEP